MVRARRSASRLSRSHFRRLPCREHGRRLVGGVRGLARSRRRIASPDRLRAARQAVVVTVGGKAGPGPARRLPGTVEHHRGGERRRRAGRGNRRKSEMVGPWGFEPQTFCTPSRRATSLRYGPIIKVGTLENSALKGVGVILPAAFKRGEAINWASVRQGTNRKPAPISPCCPQIRLRSPHQRAAWRHTPKAPCPSARVSIIPGCAP